jgi:hypothetical protein
LSKSGSEEYLAFIKSLQESEAEKKKPSRGPFLAELYYLKAVSLDYTTSIETYIKKFGTLLCCYDDLFPILDNVTDTQCSVLSKSLFNYLIQDQTPTVIAFLDKDLAN